MVKEIKKINNRTQPLWVYLLSPKRGLFIGISVLIFTAFALVNSDTNVSAATGINRTINFQGKVVNSNGTNVADGEYTFVFRIYDVSSGGSHLWTETQNNVQVTAGVFRVALGSVSSISGIDFNTDNLYLGINFNSDGEMTPRIRFASVPYAFNAEKVAGLTVTNTTGTLTIPNSETIQFGGSFTTSAQDLTLTLSGTTDVTLPTSGTLSTLAGIENLSNKTFTSSITVSGVTTDLTTGTNENLTISPNGTGQVFIQTGAGGQAALVVDKTGQGDIFTASASGVAKFVVTSSGSLQIADNQSIDTLTTSGGLNLGTTNANAAVLGSSNLNSFTVTTNSTGDSEVALPGQSIGSSEIVNNALDYDKFASNMTLDTDTTVSFSTFDYNLDLTSTGEFFIQDAGNTFAYFMADGTITLGKVASGSTLNLGIGTGADVISIGSDNTVGDTITIGNNNSNTTLAITGGNDWSITSAGESTFVEFYGSGLSDCDAATDKLLWNDATGTFSCGTDMGSNLQVVDFTDTTTEVATFATAMDIWDGTYPNITPGSTNSEILISVNIRGTSDEANDHNPVFVIRRAIGSDPVCTGGSPSTQIGGEFVGGFLTAATQDWGAVVTTSDAPSSTGNVRYTVCTTANGADDGNTDEVRVVLTEIGSASAGGGGNVAVRETDGSPSVASASTIEFGPASTSSDEFIVTDEGSGIARVRIGDQVGILNQAETVTGGWTFDTGNTTFTTAVGLNGGLTTTTSDQNLAFSANGSGDFAFTIDDNSGVLIGSSPTVAPLSVRGGIGSNAALIVDQLNSGDIFAASSSGTTRFAIDNSGNVTVGGNINLTSTNLAFSSTGGIVFAGGTLSDTQDEVDINDDLAVNGNVTLTGTSGLTLSGAGADIVFANNESIDNDSNGTITFGRNDTGTVTLTAKDNDSDAALSILSGGATSLTIDTGGSAVLGVGAANATTLNIGNTTSSTTLNLTKGASGNIVLTGFNCSTFTNGGVLTTDASGNINCQNDDGGAATSTYWDSSLGALYPNNTTYDVLFGGTSTASAKFGFININNGGTPTATISATNGNALSLDANGSITTTNAQRLTLGGGDSGEIYTASLLRLDSTNGIRGGGLSDCDNPSTAKLLWDSTTNRFSCGTDQGGGEGSSMTVRESDSSPAVSAVAVLEFGPASTSTDEFIVSDEGSGIARVRIGNQIGVLNQAETVTGGWTFDTGNTTFTTVVNLNGGLTTTTTDQNLAFSANGAGDFVFSIDSGTNMQLTGGVDDTDALVISAGDILLSDGDFDLSSGDFNVTLDAGDTFNLAKSGANAGDVANVSASSVNSIDGLQIDLTSTSDSGADTYNGLNITWSESSDADIVNAINIPNTTSTNSTATGIMIGTGWDTGILVNSGGISIVAGGLTISAGGVAVNGGNITSTQSTLTLDAGGTVQISDNLTVTGTTGLTLSGTGGDIVFANSETIDNDANGTITFGRNDAGTVTLTAKDNDATAALTITSGGASTLTLDAGGAAGVAVGTANANAVTIGNTTNGTGVTINSGTGNINIGDNAVTQVIEIGGVDANGADTIRIGTNSTSADSINIGNANSSSTVAITGGDDWSITNAGLATFTKVAGAGLSDCDTADISKLLWDSTNQTFSCGTDTSAPPTVKRNTFSGTTGITATEQSILSVSITPSSANSEIWAVGVLNTDSTTAQDRTVTQRLRRGASCAAGTQFGIDVLSFTTNTTEFGVATGVGLDSPATTSSTTYHLCAVADNTGINAISASLVVMEVNLGADLAELYNTNDPTISVGDVVELDSTLHAGVKKSSSRYGRVLGIVSTQPALLIGAGERSGVQALPVALAGRVPVKVSAENGPIKAGDLLTSSSIPGVAMKATMSGFAIAQAMEDFDGEGVGKVLAFVTNTYSQGLQHTSLLEGLTDDNYSSIERKRRDFELITNFAKSATPSSQITTDVLVAGLKVITPEVSAKIINTNGLSILNGDELGINLGDNGELTIKNSSSEAKIRFDSEGNGYFAGTITADKVSAKQIEGLEFIVRDAVSTANPGFGNPKSFSDNLLDLEASIASLSSRLERIEKLSLLSLNSNESDFEPTVVKNLVTLGTTTLTEASVLESLTVGTGNTLSITQSSIDSIGADLDIQALKQGAVSFLGGLIRFESSGKARFFEDVEFDKNVDVAGVMTAKTVSASGLKLIKSVSYLSATEAEATGSAGLVKLRKDEDFIKVLNPLVTNDSLIFITPKTRTRNSLYLRAQQEEKEDEKGFFIVESDERADEDIHFNFLIVN